MPRLAELAIAIIAVTVGTLTAQAAKKGGAGSSPPKTEQS